MSALGQKQTYAVQNGMSALPPKADMCGALAHVRFGPNSGLSRMLFDQIVSASEERLRNGESECLGSLEIDSKLIFGRRLHWQISRLLALQDPISIGRRTPMLIDKIRTIRDQPTALRE